MGSSMQNLIMALLIIGGAITAFVLIVIFVLVPIFRGIGSGISAVFGAVGWFFTHIFEFVGGVLSDMVRFIGSLLAMVVLVPLVPLNVLIGRWSAAGHFADSIKREGYVGASCVYRAVIRRPLKLLLLHGLLEGLEQRVPEAVHNAPGAEAPSRRTGTFEGYTILGSLRAGGSGAKLYVAEPAPEKRSRHRDLPARVVIKSFALTEGSSLPQIVRESRALECAKQLGHVLDHGMDGHRFFYVMPYHPGDHLGILTRQFHGESSRKLAAGGLDPKRLHLAMSYMRDLLATLSLYHKGGLWHKDVKPENVIVHDGRAHLVDLGLVTPLRSAMTLTTHGTEYFRDPEMVRMALRGVKVHQVNGAKFDIYAAGAVLYFMLENTFPAHGGLSRFALAAPEALRWIVRRAMTEYSQRYEDVDAMLADLNFVAAASDPFAIKPAELPSMRGGDVLAAQSPVIPAQPTVIPAQAGIQQDLPQDLDSRLQDHGNDQAHASSQRPRLSVQNWLTGAYAVEGAEALAASGAGLPHAAAQAVTMARRTAREQIKAARQRAADMRARAKTHRKYVMGDRSRTSPLAVMIAVATILFVAAIIINGLRDRTAGFSASAVAMADPDGRRLPVLLLADGVDTSHKRVRDKLQRVVDDTRKRGYEVVLDPAVAIQMQPAVAAWRRNPNGPADAAVEDLLERNHLFGVLHVRAAGTKRRPDVSDKLIRSSRPEALHRRAVVISGSAASAPAIAPAPELPYLLINDHPVKADPQVEARVEALVAEHRMHGWKLVVNDDVEVQVRKLWPTQAIDGAPSSSPMLQAVLREHGLGGVLRIDAGEGQAPPRERIAVMRLDRDGD